VSSSGCSTSAQVFCEFVAGVSPTNYRLFLGRVNKPPRGWRRICGKTTPNRGKASGSEIGRLL
jgi:hypothetical protein